MRKKDNRQRKEWKTYPIRDEHKYKVLADPETKRVWSFEENKYVKYKDQKGNTLDWPIMGFYCEMCETFAAHYKIYDYNEMSVCHTCLEKKHG